jgi:hypothetical protein
LYQANRANFQYIHKFREIFKQMATQMSSPTMPVSSNPTKRALWLARIVGGLAALFILMDGVMKVFSPPPVVEATVALGWPEQMILMLGIVELFCLALYLIPATSVLGALLMTGYLSGAVATHVRIGSPLFSVVFPILLALMLWAALYLTDARVRALIPLRGQIE